MPRQPCIGIRLPDLVSSAAGESGDAECVATQIPDQSQDHPHLGPFPQADAANSEPSEVSRPCPPPGRLLVLGRVTEMRDRPA